MSLVPWLVLRELVVRRGLGSVLVVAGAVALCSGLELVSRARETAVAAQVDRSAPPLRLTVSGVSATDLGRLEVGARYLQPGLRAGVQKALEGRIRSVDARLILRVPLGGREVPVIGVEPGATSALDGLRALRDGELVAGALLAELLNLQAGARMHVGSSDVILAAVLPPAGSIEDFAGFATLTTVQMLANAPGAINELRIFPLPTVEAADIEKALVLRFRDASVHRTDRGAVADHETWDALRRHRRAIYGVTALAAMLCLLVGIHLHTTERRGELATLAAMGLSATMLVVTVLGRALSVGALGALVGYFVAVAATVLQDAEAAATILPGWALLGASLGAAVVVSMSAAIPSAVLAARCDPALVLKES